MALTEVVDTFRVDATDSGPFDTQVHVQALSDGGYVYAWRERDVDGYNERDRIHIRKFDADGNPVGSEFEIPGAVHEPGPHGSGSGHLYPSIAPLADGGFAVEYNDLGMGTDYTNGSHYSSMWTWVATFNSAGVLVSQAAPLGLPVQGSPNSFTNWSSAISGDGSGGYHSAVVQLVSYPEGPSGNRIVLNGIEVLRHQGLLSSATEGYSINAGAIDVADHVDGAIAAYGRNYYTGSNERSDIWAVTTTGFQFRINESIEGNQNIGPEGDYLVQLSDGNYVLVWKDTNTTTDEGTDPGWGVHARVFRGNGTFVTGDIVLSATPAGDETAPAVAAMSGGRWIAVWEDDGGIVAQVFSATGARLGDQVATGMPASGDSITLTVLTDDRIVFAFHDGGSTTSSQIWRFPDIFGTDEADTLAGTTFDDIIYGLGGNDTIDGGLGDDYLDGGSGIDTVSYASALVAVTVDLAQIDQNTGGATGVDSLHNFENATGGAGNDTLYGNAVANVLSGSAGNDTLVGRDGDDTLIGGAGDDAFDGGSGNDTISYAGSAAGVTVNLLTNTLFGGDATGDTLTSIENLTGSPNADTLTGNALANVLDGSAGNDVLDGGGGSDTMIGGLGDDVFTVDDAGDVLTELVAGGTDEVRTALTSYTLGDNIENITGLSGGGQTFTGNALANVIDGGAGADTLIGGLGNDVYVVDNAGDVVSENAGEGTDEVRTSLASYTLGANLENLTGLVATGQALTGNGVGNVIVSLAGNDTLMGGAGNDTLTGGAGNDVLDGGIGSDTMTGGTGNDVYYVDSADVVTELAGEGTDEVRTTRAGYVLDANVENLTGLVATGQALVGNGLANVITGGAGNDQLDGKAGADTLVGGAGNDTYYIDDAGDVVSEMGGGGTDTVRTTLASYQIGTNVENLVGTGTGGQTLLGNNANNTITGTGAADTINAAGGDDTMTGGNGNDIYYVAQAGDVVVELAGQGYDIVRSTISYVLPGNVESLRILGNVGLTGTGNALDNQLIGNAGGDTLWGLAGVDRLYGIGGNDTLWGGTGDDFLFGGDGADTLHGEDGADFLRGDNEDDVLHGGTGGDNMAGGNGNDTLHGGADNDYMFGDAGNDTLWGGTGQDALWGGLNTDTFAFADGDTSADASLANRILDFAQAQGDRLDLSAMDANTLIGGDQAFAFIGANAFAGTGAASAGELRYTFVGAYTFVQGDTDGNGTADFMIRLDGNIAFNGVDVIV